MDSVTSGMIVFLGMMVFWAVVVPAVLLLAHYVES
jgi:hypothetical protein